MNLKRACFKPFVPVFRNRTKACDYMLRWDNRRNKQNMRVVNKSDWNADSKSETYWLRRILPRALHSGISPKIDRWILKTERWLGASLHLTSSQTSFRWIKIRISHTVEDGLGIWALKCFSDTFYCQFPPSSDISPLCNLSLTVFSHSDFPFLVRGW